MRLLELVEPGEFRLVQAATHNTLPYAILSHTWDHGQEITFKDLIGGTGHSRTGYEKIKFCGEQARKDSHQYFWVDTCCIDKSDSTELTTAINSMFRWYRNAKKCYVYLADVSTPGYGADVQPSQRVWEAAFRDSKWFTRGWTLQELIAPAIVEFYSKQGNRLGDKKSLEKLIHEITRIPVQALRGDPFSDFSIAERKNWAAKRQTTEVEDTVYCLLGLCEVSMPPLYGEGREAAMKRLQMTVKEFSKESSESKYPEGNAVPFIVPFDRNANFTGRESQFTKLEEKLWVGSQTSRCAITGLGGVGKTQLVLELVYRLKEKHKNCSVIWIPATNMESLNQAYRETVQQLSIPGWEDEMADVKGLLRDYLNKRNAGQWLLVFDNADDIDMWIGNSEAGSSRLVEYLPRSTQGCIVFTSRNRKAAVKLAQNNLIEVPEMNEDAAIQLLQKCLINPELINNGPDTEALLKELTYLPLAIVQAAAYVNENGITFIDYRALLAAQEEDVISLLSEDFEDDGRYHNIKNPVATTWLISFEQIQHRDPLAANYLSFMACLDPRNIPQSLLPRDTSRKKEIEAIGTLEAYSFIKKRPVDLALDLHRLVHIATRNWLQKERLLIQWSERAIIRLVDVFPTDDHRNRSVWRTYLPHVRYILLSSTTNKDGMKRIKLAMRFGNCLYKDGRYEEAATQFFEVLEIRKRTLGQEHLSTLKSMFMLALMFSLQGRWDEAEKLQSMQLEIIMRVSGQEDLNTLSTISNLASIFNNQGRWKEAEDLRLYVMETRKRKLGREHLDTLISMGDLASTFSDQGRWKEAEDLDVHVKETKKRILGPEHPETLTSMGNLASTYRNQGRFKEAEDLMLHVMETRKKILGQEHPHTLTSMGTLALTYSNQGRFKEAEDLMLHVMETRKRILGPEHPNTLLSVGNLAMILSKQGRWNADLEAHVIETRKRVLGPEHPSTLTSVSNLALTYRDRGRLKEAEDLQVSVMETRKQVLGQEHPDTLTSVGNLAMTYRDQGRLKEAEDLQVFVMETRKRLLGLEHPHTLTSMNNLAFVWKSQGRAKEALALMEECSKFRASRIGSDHPDTQSTLQALHSWREEGSKQEQVDQKDSGTN